MKELIEKWARWLDGQLNNRDRRYLTVRRDAITELASDLHGVADGLAYAEAAIPKGTTVLDVEISGGEVVAVITNGQPLPFTQQRVDEQRACEMRRVQRSLADEHATAGGN